jgi:hypothetical protein
MPCELTPSWNIAPEYLDGLDKYMEISEGFDTWAYGVALISVFLGKNSRIPQVEDSRIHKSAILPIFEEMDSQLKRELLESTLAYDPKDRKKMNTILSSFKK